MAQEKEHCSNEGCYEKYYPNPNLEPGLCDNCSILVLKTRIELLNTLRTELSSEAYWANIQMNTKKLKALEES